MRSRHEYFARLLRRQRRRYDETRNALTNTVELTGEQIGDLRLGRFMDIINVFFDARLPSGKRLQISIQQREFFMQLANGLLPIFYGAALNNRKTLQRVLRRFGMRPPCKTQAVQAARQMGKTTAQNAGAAALMLAVPTMNLHTAHMVEKARENVMGVTEMIRIVYKYGGHLVLPELDERALSVDHVHVRFLNGAVSTFKRFTAKPDRYVSPAPLPRPGRVWSGPSHTRLWPASPR